MTEEMCICGKSMKEHEAEALIFHKQQEIMARQNRLDLTDWYAVRFSETGTPIPEEIKQERQALREQISALRGEAE